MAKRRATSSRQFRTASALVVGITFIRNTMVQRPVSQWLLTANRIAHCRTHCLIFLSTFASDTCFRCCDPNEVYGGCILCIRKRKLLTSVVVVPSGGAGGGSSSRIRCFKRHRAGRLSKN